MAEATMMTAEDSLAVPMAEDSTAVAADSTAANA
jgi:hypothetical protein